MEEQPQARTFMTFSYPLAGAASAGKTSMGAILSPVILRPTKNLPGSEIFGRGEFRVQSHVNLGQGNRNK